MSAISAALAESSGQVVSAVDSWWESAMGSPEFWAALFAAVAALISAVVAWVSSKRQRNHEERLNEIANRFTHRQREIEFCKQQLNDLYSPVYMLRRASQSLRTLLPSTNPDGTDWRLVDHIEDIRNDRDEAGRTAVEEILEINKQIEDLLVTKAGLFEYFPPPSSFDTFIAHTRLLRLAWKQGKNQTSKDRIPFPYEIDQDINKAIESIRGRLIQLREGSPHNADA